VTAPRKKQEIIKFVKERIGAAFLIGKALALSALNFPLYAALVEIVEQGVQIRPEIQHLQRIRFGPGQITRACGGIRAQRAELNVFPPGERSRGPDGMNQFGQFLGIGERLAVIRKWQRDKASTADPATYATKDDAVRELVGRRRGGVNDGFIAVRAAQSVKPRSTVEDRSMRMMV